MEITDGNMIIHVEKEVDHCVADRIKTEFEQYYLRGHVKNVIFDMSEVEFMDSSGIGMIMGRYKKLRYIDGQVMVAAVPDHIDRLLKMSGIYAFISKHDNVIQAINGANKKEGSING